MKQLLNWFRRPSLENDLDRELRYHLERRTSDLIAQGVPEPEAKRRAACEIGGLDQVHEEVRDVWLTRWLRDFTHDLRFSARSFLRTPSFSATVVLLLALGIGATTAIYSLLDQVVLHALPVRDPQRLVLVDWQGDMAAVNGFGTYNLMSYPLCRDLQKQEQVFEGVLCRAATTINLASGQERRPAAAEIVSGSYFSVLGVRPAIGRLLTVDDDETPGASPVIVLSYEFWKTQLGGDPGVVGETVLVNAYPMTIVGVAAEGFHGVDVGQVPALWIPAAMSAQAIPGFDTMLDRRTRWMQILGRLREGVMVEQAKAGLEPWFKALLEEDRRLEGFPNISPERMRNYLASTLDLSPAPQGHSSLRRKLSQPLWVLFAATAVLLGLACLNVAGLFLARGSARHRELSTRLALGASRGRIGRQLLADNVLFALAGGALAVVLAPLVMKALIAFLPREIAGNAVQASIDARLLGFAFGLSVLTGFLAGLTPAWQAGRGSLSSSLRERAAGGSGGLRLRRAIVTAQIALTLILVIGAALFLETLTGLMAKGPGFDTTSLISFGVDPRRNGYDNPGAVRLIDRIHDDLRAVPGVRSSGVARFQLLTGGSWNNPMTIQADERIETDGLVHLNAVTPGFLETLGARIMAGRDFNENDTLPRDDGGRRVAIVNQAFVDRHLGGRNPLGLRIGMGVGPDVEPDAEIIGVIDNFSYRGVREESEQAYYPLSLGSGLGDNFYVRMHGSSDLALQTIRAIVQKHDPTLPMSYFRTLDEQVSRSLSTERMLAALSGGFGGLALLLSMVGLYGVMSFVVATRTREIGVRLALGATRSSALWLVMRDALSMTAAGIAIALPCAYALGRLIESQLYEVESTDPAAIAAAVTILGLTALCAALIPARRASAVNPTTALRFE